MEYIMKTIIIVCLLAAFSIDGAAAVACPNGDADCTTTEEACGTDATCAATDITQTVGTNVAVSTTLGVITNKVGTTILTLEENFAATITTFSFSSTSSMTSTFEWTSSNQNIEVSTVGAVTLKSDYTLDYEAGTAVEAVLTAKDSADPINTATVSLTLSLTDVNDNTPIFNPSAYTDSVADGATANTVATTVTATDADGTAPNNVITYSITGGNDLADWSIDGTTGVISVAADKTMNRATTSSYSLTVTATDSGTTAKSETVTVGISVAATDITQTVGTNVAVSTALGVITNKVGTTILTLEENFAATITTFSFSSTSSMTSTFEWTSSNLNIEVSTVGAVTLKSDYTLDYEAGTAVEAVLTAVDSTSPAALTATVSLTLSLTDVNDNPPIFNPSAYTDSVANGATAGTVATTVTATDADGTAANNVITYSITGGNTGTDWNIDATTGVISVAVGKTMASATTPSYSLTVTATDSGTTAETETVTVVINVVTACTSDTECNSVSEDCSTVNSANICKCKTGYTDNAGTCVAKAACTGDTDCTSTNNETCTTITGATKACRCATNYTDNGGTCLSDCLDDPTPQHGSISAGSNSVGSNKTVTCDSDYTLTGVETITCKTDSTWETPGTCNGVESILGGTILLSLSSLVVMVIYI